MRGQKRRRHPASRGQGIQRSCPQYESFQFAFLGKSLWIFTAILILPMTTLPELLIPWKPTHFFSRTSIRGNGGEGGRMATPHCLSLSPVTLLPPHCRPFPLTPDVLNHVASLSFSFGVDSLAFICHFTAARRMENIWTAVNAVADRSRDDETRA